MSIERPLDYNISLQDPVNESQEPPENPNYDQKLKNIQTHKHQIIRSGSKNNLLDPNSVKNFRLDADAAQPAYGEHTNNR